MSKSPKSLMSKLTSRLFRKVDGIQWNLMTGQAGFTTNQGDLATLSKEVTGEGAAAVTSYSIDLCPITSIGFPLPAFALITPLEQISEGDLICGADEVRGWVTKVHPQSLEIMKADGCHTRITPPKSSFMGNNGLLVVRSLTTLLGGDTATTGFQNMLMPLLMAKETNGNIEDLMPLMLMSQTGAGGAAAGANPMAAMLPMMLLGKGGSNSSMESLMPLMLMSQMGAGGAAAGANPMAAMLPMMMLSQGKSDLDEVLPILLMSQGAAGPVPGMDMQTLMMIKALGNDETEAVIAGKPELKRNPGGIPTVAPAVPPLQRL